MKINRDFISKQNSYEKNIPLWIVVHNTDNFRAGADAKAHAKAQHDGNFSGMSAHYYVDDKEWVYQAMAHDRGAWHVGVNYGGKLFGTVNNRNSIGVEMCVQSGYDYEKAFMHGAELVKYLMRTLHIDADHVVSHYDVCAKNCPSQIRARGEWGRFLRMIATENTGEDLAGGNADQRIFYRVQAGAYYSEKNAKDALQKVREAGYQDAFIKIEDSMRKIQVWAGSKAGAEKVAADLKEKGISVISRVCHL